MDTGSLVFLFASLGAIVAVALPVGLAARRRRKDHETGQPDGRTDLTK